MTAFFPASLLSIPNSSVIVQGTLVGNTNNVSSVDELLAADPSSANPLIGYQIIKGPLTASQLVPGQTINTTDTLKQFGAPDRTLAVTITAPNTVSSFAIMSPVHSALVSLLEHQLLRPSRRIKRSHGGHESVSAVQIQGVGSTAKILQADLEVRCQLKL